MNSRETILAAVQANQPTMVVLPDISIFETGTEGSLLNFASALTAVGGKISYVSGYDEILRLVWQLHGDHVRIVSPVAGLKKLLNDNLAGTTSARDLQNVEVAILNAHFGIAENGAVWLTESDMYHRALPFITQHLAVIISADDIVPTMHQAYELISKTTYDFGTFISGPSKTADIEQSLVIGAHGPRSMTVFILTIDKSEGRYE
jgi:L-lactate dehydrogenase complex protein LldG